MAEEPKPEVKTEPTKPEPTKPEPAKPEPVKSEPANPVPETRAPEPPKRKTIEVDEEEFQGMKSRLKEIEERKKKKTPPPPGPVSPPVKKRAIDRLHSSMFGR